MHDRIRLIAAENLIKPFPVKDVAVLEGSPPNRPLVTVYKIIVSHGEVARAAQRFAGVRADIARAAGHQNSLPKIAFDLHGHLIHP